MSRGIFVAGTDTGVGKTRITVALLRALQRLGISAAGMKPVAAGASGSASAGASAGDRRVALITDVRGTMNEDVAAITACSAPGCEQEIGTYSFDLPASPHIGARRDGVIIDPERVALAYRRLSRRCEAIVVEGTGGWYTPIGDHATMADIAVRLNLPVVLTVGLRLGCLNHALLSQQAIGAAGLTFAGWIGSVLDPQLCALEANIATLDARLTAPRLGLIPHGLATDRDPEHLAGAAAALFTAPRSDSRRL
jgi:dethiobiotin synthetase